MPLRFRSPLALALVALVPALALAQGAPKPAPRPVSASTGPSFIPCGFSGRATLPPDTPIQDEGGNPVARFSGGETVVTVSGFLVGSGARARVETGSGRGSFRLRGFVDSAALPVVSAQMLPVSTGHVWIGKERQVTVVGASADKIREQRAAASPLKQAFATWTACSTLKLTAGTPPGWSPSGSARGYVLKGDALELFDGPGGSNVTALYKMPGSDGVLFFSTEQSGVWVHVEYHADIIVDGWARASDLAALPRGETMDQIALLPSQRGAPRLALGGAPRVVKATREVALRSLAKDNAPVIGVIEPDADAYVIDVMAGWASVMPRALDVVPASGGQFWVKKTELGL